MPTEPVTFDLPEADAKKSSVKYTAPDGRNLYVNKKFNPDMPTGLRVTVTPVDGNVEPKSDGTHAEVAMTLEKPGKNNAKYSAVPASPGSDLYDNIYLPHSDFKGELPQRIIVAIDPL